MSTAYEQSSPTSIGGVHYPVHHLDTTAIIDDPDHSAAAVDLQIGGRSMNGFVASFATTVRARGVQDTDAGQVMGYYNRADVPVYYDLSPENLQSATTGLARYPEQHGRIDCMRFAVAPPAAATTFRSTCPPYTTSLHLCGIWTLAESPGGGTRSKREPCASPTRGTASAITTGSRSSARSNLNWRSELEIRIATDVPSFLEDAARGTLPSVSWIDPNFSSFNPIGFQPNDDHPPADIKDGQELVLAVYHALAVSPCWENSLLVIFYDEHGGFFDHVPPPEVSEDDPRTFGRYGVRVPALIVSPWIEPSAVSHIVFDHTSIIKTVLLRFCPDTLERPVSRQGLRARFKRPGQAVWPLT
jgi:phospholipase C